MNRASEGLPMGPYTLSCHGIPFATSPSLNEAKQDIDNHLRECFEDPVTGPVTWHECGTNGLLLGHADGEWLMHAIRPDQQEADV